MEILIFGVAILASALGLVAWLRLVDDLSEREEWDRFQRAMDDAQNPKEK